MSHQSRIRTLVPLAVALLAALSLMGAAPPGRTSAAVVQASAVVAPDAPPPPLITYQGRLVVPATGEPVPDGAYRARFELWASEVGGTALWGEEQSIESRNGLFSVTLGTVNPIDPALFDSYGRWLSVSIQPDGPLAPRIRIAHAPYAIYANRAGSAVVADLAANADWLGGQPASAYAAASHTHDAANITSGTLAVARYSAIADLTDEGYLGNASGDLAVNNGTVQTNLNADLLDGNHSSAFAAASHTHTGASIVDGSLGTADLADGSVTSAKIADGGVATADLANSSVTTVKIADGAVTAAKLASNVAPKFFALNTFGAFLGGGATFETGYGPYAGMRLPDSGTPQFSFSFVIPPDYTSGTNLTVRFIWHTPAVSCGIVLAPNYISVARAGRTHIMGGSVTDGLTMVGGNVLSAPSTANQSSAKDMTISTPVPGTNLQAGDSIIFGVYRSSGNASDTCANYLAIQGVSVSYQ